MLTDKLGSRVKFPQGEQKKFLERTLPALDVKQSELADISNVCDRTLRDWKREKCNMSFSSLKTICKKMGINIPKNIKIFPKYWSVKKASKLGGRRYVELYGSPGTLESRRKGGLATQSRFRSDPEFAKKIQFIIRKRIKRPRKSAALAEFVGIMLGDGGIRNDYQITISFNARKDRDYATYIQHLVRNLFGVSSVRYIRKKRGRADIVITARNLVEFLEEIGIKKGNKIANQVNIPRWIWDSEKYKIACLRGLVDTDGGFYYHKYIVNRKRYVYLKMCFTSYSRPLLRSVTTILKNLGLRPKNTAKNRVYLYSLPQLHSYIKKAGTNNPRYLDIYNNFVNIYK